VASVASNYNLPVNGRSFRRVEILTGTPRRRRWSVAEKAAIVAESLAPGAVTSAIALRHGLHRNLLYDWRRDDWRREFRAAAFADSGVSASNFVPVVADNCVGSGAAAIKIEIGGAIARVEPGGSSRGGGEPGVELAFLGEVIRRLKATP
jgi:transposase